MWRPYRCERLNRYFRAPNFNGGIGGDEPSRIQPAHAMRDDMDRLFRVENALQQCTLDALPKHTGTLIGSGSWIERGCEYGCVKELSQVLRNPIEVADRADAAEAQNSMDENDIHCFLTLTLQAEGVRHGP
jgi:hypothetical protein